MSLKNVLNYCTMLDSSGFSNLIGFTNVITYKYNAYIYTRKGKIVYYEVGDRRPIAPKEYSLRKIDVLWNKMYNWIATIAASEVSSKHCSKGACSIDYQYGLFNLLSIEIYAKFHFTNIVELNFFDEMIRIQRVRLMYRDNLLKKIKKVEDINIIVKQFNQIFSSTNKNNGIEQNYNFNLLLDSKVFLNYLYLKDYLELEKITSELSIAYVDFHFKETSQVSNSWRKRYELFIQFMLLDVISNKFAIKKYKEIVEKINDSNTMEEFIDSL